jgi:serine/threonine-protein kinase
VTGQRTDDAAFAQVNEDEVLVGSVVENRYIVRAVLGQGTTGTVFDVEHLVTGRPGAMKVLRARYVGSDVLLRVFHGDARAAFALPHPALCEVFDAGQLPDGAPFFVMERLFGETLANRIHRERLSVGAAVDVMMQVLAALDAVHARDLIVRDMRPQNVFLAHRRGCRPVVKLLDVGLARLVPLGRVQDDWDAMRSVLGGSDASGSLALPYYLSPERTRTEHGLGPASDVFVAGTVFYEALTGQKPFVSTSWSGLLLQIAQAQPVPMSGFRADIPPELDALVARALAQNPAHRPASAAEFQDELRAVFERGRRSASRPAPSASAVAVAPSASPPTNPRRARVSPSSSSIPIGVDATRGLPGSIGAVARLPAPAGLPDDDVFEEQTRTDRNVRALLHDAPVDAPVDSPARGADEASAESPLRTVPPPPAVRDDLDIDVDVDLDDETEKLRTSRVREDDETATMALTPAVRAQIEAMTRARVEPPAPEPPQDLEPSPHTRRMK